MATALTRMGRTDEALFYARQAVRLSPERAENHAALAAAEMETDPETAKVSLQEALRLDPLCEDALHLQFQMLNRHASPHEAAKALTVYTAHASHPVLVRVAVGAFLTKFISVVHLGQFWCVVLTMMLLLLVRLANLPGDILPLPLILATVLTCRATIVRTRAFRLYFAGRRWRLVRAYIRHNRHLALWAAALPFLWAGLVIGTIRALHGDDVILIGTTGASLAHLALGWVGVAFAPLLQRQST